MIVTRRDFLRAGAAAAAIASIPRPLLAAAPWAAAEGGVRIEDPRVKQLAMRALEAARAAGASYADVRLTHVRERLCQASGFSASDDERLHVGVRALVDGYWGFASSAYWMPDEVARAAREAVALARTNALGAPRTVELGTVPVVADGSWTMPVKVDPFTVPLDEVMDVGNGIGIYITRAVDPYPPRINFRFVRQAKAFASTEGSYLTQTTWRTGGEVEFLMRKANSYVTLDALTPAGRGWEYIRDAKLYDAVSARAEETLADARLPVKPVEVGRYDVVFDAASMAALLDETLGPATELDRAMGYEANAGGTSFLSDPLAMLGTLQLGAPLLSVTADRSADGGLATVKWDDEGVAPGECRLIDKGVLLDFQTTRESAGWLREFYARAGRPQGSNGCAGAPSAGDATMQHRPNLSIVPGREAKGFDELVAATAQGLAFRRGEVWSDFGNAGGAGRGDAYEIRNGKRVARIKGAGFLFRSAELWKSIDLLGGAASRRWFGMKADKGEPRQQAWHSVGAVPARAKQLTIIDVARKA